MSEEKMREEFESRFSTKPARNGEYYVSEYYSEQWHSFRAIWKAATKSCAAIKDAEIADLQRSVKELREALEDADNHGCYGNNEKVNKALANSEHHASRALEKMLLEAEIRVLDLAYMKCSPYGEEFGFMLTERKAKLAELNKE